jgi:hypothetical protein
MDLFDGGVGSLFGIFMGGIWLAEWCWKPRREAEARASEENSA